MKVFGVFGMWASVAAMVICLLVAQFLEGRAVSVAYLFAGLYLLSAFWLWLDVVATQRRKRRREG